MRFSVSCGLALVVASFSHTPLIHSQDLPVLRWSVSTPDPNPADCAEQLSILRRALLDYDVPIADRFNRAVSRQFSWVVVCDEKTWFHLKLLPQYRNTKTNTGMTDFSNHVVYLNGFGRSEWSLRDTVAHEIGHQMCQCSDEDTADLNKFQVQHQAKQLARAAAKASASLGGQ